MDDDRLGIVMQRLEDMEAMLASIAAMLRALVLDDGDPVALASQDRPGPYAERDQTQPL